MIVQTGRPYGHSGVLDSAAWMEQPAEWVGLATLITTQRHVYVDALLAAAEDPYAIDGPLAMPYVVEWRGNYYLEDGHTRVAVAALRGDREILARVAHLPPEGQGDA